MTGIRRKRIYLHCSRFYMNHSGKLYSIAFCFCCLIMTTTAKSQNAFDWYKKQLSNKRYNDYMANATVDTAIRIELNKAGNRPDSGIKYGQAVDLKSFLRNGTIVLPKSYTVASVDLYFTGNGFVTPYVSRLSGNSVATLYLLQKCTIGTNLIFDNVLLRDSLGKQVPATGGCILTDMQKTGIPVLPVDTCILDVMDNLNRRFVSGTIYFTGTGFPNPVTMPAVESLLPVKRSLIARIQPGTTVVFDRCNYKDATSNRIVSLNKQVKLFAK